MKFLFRFTKGEWFAVIFLLLIIMVSYLFYYLYDENGSPNIDLSSFRKNVDEFVLRQAEIEDSILTEREIRNNRYKKYDYHRKEYKSYRRSFITYFDSLRYKNERPAFAKRERKNEYTIVKIELNSCDTVDIKSIPQFGSKRAAKIVEYRDKLGGFYSLSQISEIYILQNIELTYLEKYFSIDFSKIKKLKINKIGYKELVAHPYFDAYLAKSVLNYREKNGKITSVEDFKKATNVYDELLQKIAPYLTFE